VLDAVDTLLDVAILLSPIVAGPVTGATLLALIEPKNALVKLARDALKKFAKPGPGDYLDQATRLAATNCLLTYTAYFDALQRRLPELMKDVELSEEDKKRIAEGRSGRPSAVNAMLRKIRTQDLSGSFSSVSLADQIISVPHPVNEGTEVNVRLALYGNMSLHAMEILSGHDSIWMHLPGASREHLASVVTDEVPALAESMYRAELAGLAFDFPQFLIWLVLTDQDTKDALIRRIGANNRVQFELVGRTVDLGLRGLAEEMTGIRRALADLGSPVSDQPSDPRLGAVAEDLHRRYLIQIGKPVIDDTYEPVRGPKLGYPTRDECYVPQAYRLASCDDPAMHLERDDSWTDRPVGDDLGRFLLGYLESAYSTQRPLLILGHPGSGKSLLTQVLAARLAYPAYTTVRIQLCDADPRKGIQEQIEAQIREDTGEDVPWTRFARVLPSPPVVILDGYDELLQATGSVHADYLDRVREFQEREADLRRPVRVIVTSRITLIDKVSVPRGTSIVRLEEFDEQRRDAWTTVWNDRNNGYFTDAGVRPFRLPANPGITELAAQPLLLLMLALYDSAANELSSRPDIDQTRLYDELLTRFIRRELNKDPEGFRKLPAADQQARLTRELERLGVAAIGMFNRQALVIRRDELDKDLRYFNAQQSRPEAGMRPLTQADLLLGSFFFIHESRSRLAEAADDPTAGPTAFEFLHKTFGEFLTADFILRQILIQAETVAQMESVSGLADPLRQRLESLDKTWFGCLVHTPLHTQPNVLTLLREWGGHRLAAGTRSRSDLLAALDMIVLAQLRGLLTATTLPVLAAQDRDTPYEPLPALAHLAIYSLNLILLRAYLSDDLYVLDEADLGGQPAICRPWDRLTALWRSWFPPESLAALASRFTATRQDTRITIEPSISPLAMATGTALAAAYNVGLAFADNLTTASLGLHLTGVESTPEGYLDNLRERVRAEAPDLLPAMDIAASRTSRRLPAELPVLSPGFIDAYGGRNAYAYEISAPDYLPPGHALEFADLADRLLLSPPLVPRVVRASTMSQFARLSRYAAEVAVHSRVSWEPRWLPDLIGSNPSGEHLRELLLSPAAAPVLRAVLQQFDAGQWVKAIEQALAGDTDSVFDVDAAAAVAIIAWRGRSASLCVRTLDSIIETCEQGTWNLLDIPGQLWGDLADLLVSADSDIARRRERFTNLICGELGIRNLEEILRRVEVPTAAEFVVHALRIGKYISGKAQEDIASRIFSSARGSVNWLRGCFLPLIRFARENDSRRLVEYLFSDYLQGFDNDRRLNRPWQKTLGVPQDQTLETLDIESVSMDLTYREAMDLRWALDVARQPKRGSATKLPRSPRPGRARPAKP
jgi:adenylate kinase family enzyme